MSKYDATYMYRGVVGRRGNCLDGIVVLVVKLVIMHGLVKWI